MPEENKTEETQQKVPKEKYALFIGCAMKAKSPHLEKVNREVFKRLDIELVDLDFHCCPYVGSIRDVDDEHWLIMAALNIVKAEEKGLDIMVLCTGCTQTLTEAAHRLEDSETRKRINVELAKVKKEYKGSSKIKFFGQVLYENLQKIQDLKVKEIELNVATHSGCHILRPSKIMQFDDATVPKKLDEMVTAVGCDAIDYRHKTLCCGSPAFPNDREASFNMMEEKVRDVTSHDADCLVVVCPACFMHYDRNQLIAKNQRKFDPVPVLFYSQLLGLALGMSVEEIELSHNRNKTEDFELKLKSF